MSDLQQRNEAFRDFLATLNPAQRDAVESTEGPVLVIAGPGTGKTHILAARIGNILLNTDARAQNILCLTFTDAGANAMRKRLLTQIGPEAQRVPIFTFHGFCNRVIQENLEYFGSGGLEPLSDLERIEIVREILGKLPVTHALRNGRKDAFQYETQVRDLFSNMKKEGWTPGYILKKSDEFLNGLSSNPDYIYQRNTKNAKKGELKTSRIQDIREKLERLKAGADLFPKYQSALEKAGRYEYEDMVLWVNRAFEKNEALLRNYQERYQYILVDEFQDTNGAQFRLVNQLLDFWETPNIFIVGDDDQSIYEFQGARLENLLQFSRQYHKGLKVIVLEENYRSTQAILDAAGKVVEHNQLRAIGKLDEPLAKTLRASTSETGLPLIQQYDTRLHEIADVAERIENLIRNGVPPAEIAVLYSRHAQSNQLQSLLGKKGIPFRTKRPMNVLEIPVMQHFRALLQYLEAELERPFSGEPLLFRLSHAVFFGLKPLDLAQIAIEGVLDRERQTSAPDQLPGNGAAFLWRKILSDEDRLRRIKLADPEKIIRFGRQLDQWISDAANFALPQLIGRLYNQSGLLDWVLNQPDKIWYLQVLHSFLEALPQPQKNPSTAQNKAGGALRYFLQMLDQMEANKLSLPLRQQVETEAGVQLLTAHAAKGLEFRHVFIIDNVEDAWEKVSQSHRNQFTLPATLTLSGEEDALEARRRLFYVALTRARRGLNISFSLQSNDGKPLQRTRFIDETGLPAEAVNVAPARLIETQSLLLLESEQPQVTLPEAAVVDALLADFVLTITALNRYLRCPLAFWYEDMLRAPKTISEAAAYGTAMHGALQRFFLKMKADKKYQWPTLESLIKLFVAEMQRLQLNFSENGFLQYSNLGKENLRRIHVEQIPFWRKKAIVERRIDKVELEGIPLSGVLDKIEWLENGTMRIIDYKTGSPDPKRTAAPNEQQTAGGEFWRQLAFYQILVETARIYPEPVGKTAISWLETDKRGAFPVYEINFTREEIHFVQNLIKDTYQKIQQREFHTGCGKPDCSWCTMIRDSSAADALAGTIEETLDD